MSRLVTVRVSRAAAIQRAGRAGRIAPGSCYRLWSEYEQQTLLAYDPPEIRTADLCELALNLALWGVNDAGDLPWVEPPPSASLAEARNTLHLLGGLDEKCRITKLGRRMAELPLHPRLSRLLIAGVDDSRTKLERTANAVIEERLLKSAQKGEFRLLLKHRPIIEKTSDGKFDLQLSGHVHKGQIFPFNLLTWLSFPVKSGLTVMKSGSHLYVSRGTGVWGPPIRFLAPPEITVIDLLPEKGFSKNN